LIDKILKQDQGITFGLFAPDEPEAPVEEAEEEEEEGAAPKKPKEPVERLPKHILVEEVVEEPRIHYYQVPKLGSYLAIKLEYESCLSEEAFDAAVVDYLEVDLKRAE